MRAPQHLEQIFLSFEDADDLVDCVNDLHAEQLSATKH